MNHNTTKIRSLALLAALAFMLGSAEYAEATVVAHYTFDALPGDDSSGNGNNLTVVGTTPASRFGSPALSLNGTPVVGDHMFVNDNASFGTITDNVTFSAWINPDSTDGGYVLNKGSYLVREQFSMGLNGGLLQLRVNESDTTTHIILSTQVIPIGTWTHVTGVYKGTGTGTGLSIYLNGVFDTTNSAPSGLLEDNSEPFRIGSDFGNPIGARYDGQVDEVSIYNTALTESEVSDLYQSTVPEPSTAILVGMGLLSMSATRRRPQARVV